LHPSLTVHLTILRVPEIHDGYEYTIYISRTTTVQDAINVATEELGLTKSLPIPGGGNLDYVLEEAWIDGKQDSE
jgi:diaphanous 1